MVLISACGTGYYLQDFLTTEVVDMEKEIATIESDLGKKTNELKRLQDFAQNIERVKQELRELNLQLETALEHMPRTFNLSGLLRRFTMLAQNSGVELSSFKPKKSVDTAGAFYATIGIDFELRGTFSQILVFLDQLSRLKRIINIESIRMRATEMSQIKTVGALTTTQGSIRTYRFSE
jgi:type IV pilus assembly protein PilO